MKRILFCVLMLSACSAEKKVNSNIAIEDMTDRKFALFYQFIGFGSNMFKMQPTFRITNTIFTYTLEQTWVYRGEKPRIIPLLKGNIRHSSIDSIIAILNNVQDTIIRKNNPHIMSGGEAYIKISFYEKKYTFSIHNTGDTLASKIVAVLNTYIPDKYKKLIIPDYDRQTKQ